MNKKDEKRFIDFLRTGEKQEIGTGDGGFLIPQFAKFRAKGFMGWFYRLIKDERGWDVGNLYDELTSRVKKMRTKMIENPNGKMEIQIDDEAAFIPERVIRVGIEYGQKETTNDYSLVRTFEVEPSKNRYIIHYVMGGMKIQNYYKRGRWETAEYGVPRFHVWELLNG